MRSAKRSRRSVTVTKMPRRSPHWSASLAKLPREDVQAEAIETLADAVEDGIHPVVLDLAARGATARIRREALESIGDSASKLADVQALDAAQRAIARAIFDDPDLTRA